jgi:hypothetical protein
MAIIGRNRTLQVFVVRMEEGRGMKIGIAISKTMLPRAILSLKIWPL